VLLARRRRGLEDEDVDELPERSGVAPIPPGEGGPSAPGEETPTGIPAGTAEGPGDPTVEHSEEHEIQETPA
jgi:hypothetical protein